MSEFKDVCVYVEQRRGVIQEASLQLLGEGRRLADKLNVSLMAFMVGYNIDGIVNEPVYYGADKVVYVDDEMCRYYNVEVYTQVLAELVLKYKPEIFLVAGTKYGRELAPSIAARLETGITADCTGFDIDENRNLVQIRPPFGGRVLAYIITPTRRPQIATARPNVFPTPRRNVKRNGEVVRESIAIRKPKLELVEFRESVDKELPIEKAEVIVAIGRGISRSDYQLAYELCRIFTSSTVGCSRPLVDQGLMPRSKQVGQTGKTVRPKLYIAIGISGAVQHIAGMKDSKYVIAINKDPNAEIFKFCDFGIVGDYREVIPKLIEVFGRKH
jgi:electron transfer flavoprotein alpha subunit